MSSGNGYVAPDDSVEIVLDRRRRLRYTSRSIFELERVSGMSARKLLSRLQRRLLAIRSFLVERAILGAEGDGASEALAALPAALQEELQDTLEEHELTATLIVQLVWSGLLHEAPSLSVDEVGAWLLDGEDCAAQLENALWSAAAAFFSRMLPREAAKSFRVGVQRMRTAGEPAETQHSEQGSASVSSGS